MSNKCGHLTYDEAWEAFPPSPKEVNTYKLWFCPECSHWYSSVDLAEQPKDRTVSINDPLPWVDDKPGLSTVCTLLERIAVALEKIEERSRILDITVNVNQTPPTNPD
jgi:hypothetical protein